MPQASACESVRTIDLAVRDEHGEFVAAIATSLAPAAREESPTAVFLGTRWKRLTASRSASAGG
jgi:hypothetical protein